MVKAAACIKYNDAGALSFNQLRMNIPHGAEALTCLKKPLNRLFVARARHDKTTLNALHFCASLKNYANAL